LSVQGFPVKVKKAPEDRPVLSWENYTGTARDRLVIGLLSNRLLNPSMAYQIVVESFSHRGKERLRFFVIKIGDFLRRHSGCLILKF
jgi:hypothetical protein